MTNFMKREKDLIAEFQKEMDGYGLKVDNGTGGMYGEGCYRLEMTTKIERAKGKKALIALLLGNGYTVNKFMFTDRKTGERYMSFGKAGTMHDWTLDETATEGVVKHALDLGINFFDTANGYSAGTSEEYLGRALKKELWNL